MIESVWTTTGHGDLKKLLRSVKFHESAREHILCMLGLKHLENSRVTIVDALTEHNYLFKKK